MSPENNRPWIENLLPIVIVLGLAALAMVWNIVAAVAILVVGLGIVLARYIQRQQPREPGE